MQKGYISEIFVSFQGEGVYAGRRQLFIRFAGCNLRCRYCDTPDSLERVESFRVCGASGTTCGVNPLGVRELLSHAGSLLEGEWPIDGVALTGGEPLLQAEFLAGLLSSDILPRPRLLETNGVLPEQLAVVLPLVDAVSMDLKIPSNTGEPAFWDSHASFLRLARGKVHVKVLVDAGTLVEEVEHAAGLVREEAPETMVFLQPITEPSGRVVLTQRELDTFYRATRSHLDEVRIVPQTHKMLGIR